MRASKRQSSITEVYPREGAIKMLNKVKSAFGGKKILIPGLLAGTAALVVGVGVNWTVGFLLPGVATEYQNPALFRPWSDPLMSLIFVQPFVLGIVLAWLWGKVKGSIKGKDVWEKGLQFGIFYWILGIPGMFISYSTFPVSLLMIFSWSCSGFVQGVVAGWVLAKMAK